MDLVVWWRVLVWVASVAALGTWLHIRAVRKYAREMNEARRRT